MGMAIGLLCSFGARIEFWTSFHPACAVKESFLLALGMTRLVRRRRWASDSVQRSRAADRNCRRRLWCDAEKEGEAILGLKL